MVYNETPMKGLTVNLFKNRAFHVQVVDPIATPNTTPPAEPKPPMDLVKLTAVTKHLVTHAAMVGGSAYAGKKILDTACEIAIIAAKAKFK